MTSKINLGESLFGNKVNSSRNPFEAVARAKKCYENLLDSNRMMIKADYDNLYIENINEGCYGVSRFLTIVGVLGYKPNPVGKVLNNVGSQENDTIYIYGCPDFARTDKLFNVFIRPRPTDYDDIKSMSNILGLLVHGMGLNLSGFFPEVDHITEDGKVSLKKNLYPIVYIAMCPITGVNTIHILGISDKCFIRATDTELLSKMKDETITALDKNKILDEFYCNILTNFIRKTYTDDKICGLDPFDVFSNAPQSIFGMMLGGEDTSTGSIIS